MDKNLKVYTSEKVVQWYRHLKEIVPVEKMVFDKYMNVLKQGDVLDIGIGGGRTTAYLLNICHEYTGIDYSENFVSSVKEEYPNARCLVMDARDLSFFNDESFDFVNFSFNGIDYVNLEGRTKIISEISRILKPGGLFFFSTHNKNHFSFNKLPWFNKENSFFINLKTFLKLFPFLIKKVAHKKDETIKENYAVINDSAHNYGLMTFYTSPAFLRKQLTDSGFENIELYLKSGEKKEDPLLEEWIFVTGKKISA